jgi:2-haloacid dehalogenase
MNRPILFDAYGTLFDLKAAAMSVLGQLGPVGDGLFDAWRELQLKYAWLSALRGEYVPFDQVSGAAFADLLGQQRLPAELKERFMRAIGRAPVFAEVPDQLRALQERGIPLAILSNGTAAQLQDLVEAASLTYVFDRLISVESAQTYKPAPDAYALGTRAYGCEANDALFVSSNTWDVQGAASFGYEVAWLRRGREQWPASLPAPAHVISGLGELAALRE